MREVIWILIACFAITTVIVSVGEALHENIFFLAPFNQATQRFNDALLRNDTHGMAEALHDECEALKASWAINKEECTP